MTNFGLILQDFEQPFRRNQLVLALQFSFKIFFDLPKNEVGKCIKSIHICHLWVLTRFSAESEKNLWELLNLKLNTRLPTKKMRKLDVDAFREEGKRVKSQIHLTIISRDC